MTHQISLWDIHDAAFLELSGIEVNLVLHGTRVVFEAEDDERVNKLLQTLHDNPRIPITDFIRVLKRLRARMLELRDSQSAGVRR